MKQMINLKDAVDIWETEVGRMTHASHIHPSEDVLEKLAQGHPLPERKKWLEHLAACTSCRDRWIDYMIEGAQSTGYMDMAVAKAAGHDQKNEDIMEVCTALANCRITIRRSLEQSNIGFISMSIINSKIDLEGREMEIRDKNGNRLIKGVISQGTLEGLVQNYDDITFPLSILSTYCEE